MNLNALILEAIATINKELNIEALHAPTHTTPLFELLDSLGTLDLILELESRLETLTGHYIAVADLHSMDKQLTPFKTLETLEQYLNQRIADESH